VKKLVSIIEDPLGNVIGASTDQGDIKLTPEEIVPRAQLRSVATVLATKYQVEIPTELLPLVTPAKP
jgi:hypothetical protein